MELTTIEERDILQRLRTKRLGRGRLMVVDECASTNQIATRLAEDGAPDGLVVLARTQTAGKGRLGRTWYSPCGGVWMSVLMRPTEALDVNAVPLIGALGVAKAIAKLGVKARVRWPNDVVVDGRKISGVLAESKSAGNELSYIVVGMGINANFDASALESVAQASTSLLSILGHPVDLSKLIATLLNETERIFDSLHTSSNHLLDQLREAECSRGSHVKIRTPQRELDGVIDDYESLTRVRIMTENGLMLVANESLVSVDYQSD